jgi:Tfp pilus assembly protein PilN
MALREINLVPNSLVSRRFLYRHLSVWTMCLVVGISLVIAYHLYQTRVILEKERALKSLQEVPQHLSLKIEEVKKVQEDLETLGRQQAILKTITGNEPYCEILIRLSRMLNDLTWLNQLSLERVKGAGHAIDLNLMGYSFSNEALGSLLDSLSRDSAFESVELRLASDVKVKRPEHEAEETLEAVRFLIHCRILGAS